MFKIEMLQAGWGDCLWIEYGADANNSFRVLIDGGIVPTYELIERRILNLPEDKRHFELFVITHIDGDHIEGAIKLLGRIKRLGVSFGDIWFNGYEQILGATDKLGGIYGEFLSALITKENLIWNKAFGGAAVVIPKDGKPPTVNLAGNLKITLLSPTRQNLKKLLPVWNKDIEKNGLEENKSIEAVLAKLQERSALRPEDELDDRMGARRLAAPVRGDADIKSLASSPFTEDGSEANGSSIAFLMEYEDPEDGKEKKCLLTGDAFPSVISDSLKRLISGEQSKIKVDLLKVSHHGSRNNTNKELLKLIDCRNYFFSSSGQKFFHPDKETIARILVNAGKKNNPQLYFNYVSKFNEVWNNQKLMGGEYPYEPQYVKSDEDAVRIYL